jgi:hypothetical protein
LEGLVVGFEALVERIRQRFGEGAVRRVLEGVEEAIRKDPKLTRFGALLLVAGELGYLRSEGDARPSLRIGELVGGLRSVSVTGRLLGLKGPIERGGKRMLVLRLADGSGGVDVVAWGQAADRVASSGIGVGDAVRISNARTKEGPDGEVELHLDEGSMVEAAQVPDLPPLTALVTGFPQRVERRSLDVMGTVVGLSEERAVTLSGKETRVRDVLISVGGQLVELTVWSKHVEGAPQLEPWTEFLITSLRYRDGGLSTSSRTCVSPLSRSTPSEALGPLRVLSSRPDGTCLLTNGRSYFPARGKALDRDVVFSVLSCRFVREGRHWWMEPGEVEPLEGVEVSEPADVPLGELRKGMRGIAVSGKLLNKSQLSEVRAPSGRVATVAFWLSDGARSVYCRAWREAAERISSIPEGRVVRLRYVRVEADRYGGTVVTLDPESDVFELTEA